MAKSGALGKAVDDALASSPDNVAAYRAGKTQMLGYFVGAAMKAMKGKGNPKLINELLVRSSTADHSIGGGGGR